MSHGRGCRDPASSKPAVPAQHPVPGRADQTHAQDQGEGGILYLMSVLSIKKSNKFVNLDLKFIRS